MPTKRKQPSAKASQRSKAASTRPASFANLLARATPPVAATAAALREIIQRVLPNLDENIYGGATTALALYSRGKSSNVICGIGPGSAHCLLYIHHAEGLDHPALKIEGKGKHCIHVKFAEAAAISSGAVTELLKAAASRAPK